MAYEIFNLLQPQIYFDIRNNPSRTAWLNQRNVLKYRRSSVSNESSIDTVGHPRAAQRNIRSRRYFQRFSDG